MFRAPELIPSGEQEVLIEELDKKAESAREIIVDPISPSMTPPNDKL